MRTPMLTLHLLPSLFATLIADPLAYARRSFLEESNPSFERVENVLQHQRASPKSTAQCPYAPTGPIETTLCDYESLESVNDILFASLNDLVHTPFFKYFQVDLYRECPFWQENGFCMHRECGITSVNESDIPEKWRAAALSRIEMPSQQEIKALPGCYYKDSDYCFLDDHTEGDYIDLTANPEQFTGYSGPSAHRVWSSIYDDNCFGISEATLMKDPPAPVPEPVGSNQSIFGLTPPKKSEDPTGQCLEKQIYYKIISGMHASISTHLCYDTLDQRTGNWGPNLQCFIDRVASHPERLQYIYFNTVLLLRAVSRIGRYLTAYDYCTGDHSEDAAILHIVENIVKISTSVGKFDETVLFRGENANLLKLEFKEHFRNVSRIMDCVGCDKCRLWGKVQTTGLGVALKVLFELDEKTLDPATNPHLLQRTEVVALMNTLHRFSESLQAFDRFRDMWTEQESMRHRSPQPSAAQQIEESQPCARSLSIPCLIDTTKHRASKVLNMCRDSIHSCAQFVSDSLDGLRRLTEAKGGVPRPDL